MTGISLLLGYVFFAANNAEWQRWLMFAVASVEFAVLLIGGFGIRYAERGGANITVLSVVFVVFAGIAQLLSTILMFHVAPYIIVNGILILVYIGIAYALTKALNN
jgi:hypothetical protein